MSETGIASIRQDTIHIQGEGRTSSPDMWNDADWNWFWFCDRCGAESRRSSKERASRWADHHRCAE